MTNNLKTCQLNIMSTVKKAEGSMIIDWEKIVDEIVNKFS